MRSHTEISNHGFTLIELLVAMAISGIVMAGVYSVFYTQQKSSRAQEQVSAMQQNLRAGMYFMMREISMAGYDPPDPTIQPPVGDAGAGINIANVAELEFTADHNDDGDCDNIPPGNDPNEKIRYALTNDADGDGIADGSPCNLGREIWGGGLQPVAENIDALNFVYFDASGVTPPATLADIRSIQITLVARTGRGDPGYTNNTAYRNKQGAVICTAPGDNFRRKSLTCEIRCRNLGL